MADELDYKPGMVYDMAKRKYVNPVDQASVSYGDAVYGTSTTLPSVATPTTVDTYGKTPAQLGTDEGLFGLGTTNQWGTAVGLGGLAMKAIALPGQMEYYGAQTDLAKQQLASNKQAMADKQTFNTNWANASNGLAARSVG